MLFRSRSQTPGSPPLDEGEYEPASLGTSASTRYPTPSCPVPSRLTPNHPIYFSMRLTFTCFHTAIPFPYIHIPSLTSLSYAKDALEYKSSFSKRPPSLLTLSLLVFFSSHHFPLTLFPLERCISFHFYFSPRSSVDQSQTGGLGTRF